MVKTNIVEGFSRGISINVFQNPADVTNGYHAQRALSRITFSKNETRLNFEN